MNSITSSAAAVWPRDVKYRFLNVGGATVDVVEPPADERRAEAVCQGCHSSHTGEYGVTGVLLDWAQRHAERCRALPRPTAVVEA
ncbi:hypothetical protein [Streptomyces sp. NPDC097619]|uniref:hypothetical protein n=1 Tax=Streptomyces sp. NPDC097619 TaxID=3157228 RepID=UPI00332E7D04